MPTTFVGLVLFVVFLTPGFIYAAQRRRVVPTADRSALMETAATLSISLAANAITLAAFGAVRGLAPRHTPEVGRLLDDTKSYWIENLPYVTGWLGTLVATSCAVAFIAARWERIHSLIERLVQPELRDSSAWNEVFVAPDGHYVHLGIDLSDGSYLRGRLVWFSTNLDETPDRELVLGQPLTIRLADEEREHGIGSDRVIVAARKIDRIDVDRVQEPPVQRTQSRTDLSVTTRPTMSEVSQ